MLKIDNSIRLITSCTSYLTSFHKNKLKNTIAFVGIQLRVEAGVAKAVMQGQFTRAPCTSANSILSIVVYVCVCVYM